MVGFLGNVIAGYTEEMKGISVVNNLDNKKTKFKTVLEVPSNFFEGIDTEDSIRLKLDKNDNAQEQVNNVVKVLQNLETWALHFGGLVYELEDDCGVLHKYTIKNFSIVNVVGEGADDNGNPVYSFNVNYLILHEQGKEPK